MTRSHLVNSQQRLDLKRGRECDATWGQVETKALPHPVTKRAGPSNSMT